MFLVSDKFNDRENRISAYFEDDPALGVLLAAIHFEWTAKRAILKLGQMPTVRLKKKLESVYRYEDYTKLWKQEVVPKHKKRLTQIINNPKYLQEEAWDLRNKLVHGAASCSASYAEKRFSAFMSAAKTVEEFVSKRGLDINARLKTRKEK